MGDVAICTATPHAVVAAVANHVAARMAAMARVKEPRMKISGPMPAASAATTAMNLFIPGDNSLMNVANCVNFLMTGVNATDTNPPNSIAKPSTAEPNALDAPAAVMSMMSAISFADPAAFSNSVFNSASKSVFSTNFKRPDCARWPTSSIAPPRSKPFSAKSLMASAVDFPDVSISEMIRRNIVPAIDPLIPLFANTANIADVFSNDMPADDAIGATIFIASANDSISRADELNDFAITSVTRPVSLTSKLNPRKVAPATSAERAKSLPDACAKFNVASVTPVICLAVKPSFANSNCSPATSRALNIVERPNSLAFSDNNLNSSAVAPETAFTLAISNSKSRNTLNETAPNATIGAVTFIDIFLPNCCILRPALSIARSALFRPLRNGAMFAVNLKFKLLRLAIGFCAFFASVNHI